MTYVVIGCALKWQPSLGKYEDIAETVYEETRTDDRTVAFWHLVRKLGETDSLASAETMEALRFGFLELGTLPTCNGYAVRDLHAVIIGEEEEG